MRRFPVVAGVLAAALLFVMPLLFARAPAVAPDVAKYFTASEIARADAYHATRLPLGLASFLLGLVVTVIVAIGPAGRALGGWAVRVTAGRWIATGALLAAVATLAPLLATLPLAILRHRLDRRYGLATNSDFSALTDVAKAAGVGLILAIVAGVGFVALAKLLPRAWPAVTAGAGAVMLVVLVLLFPVVYEPLFNKFQPVDEATRARIVAIADQAGVPIREVLVADASRRTSRHNAYVSGLGATRRVVLYDTLLLGAPADEVDLVVAHELAHVRNDDVRDGTLLGVVGVIVGVAVLALLLRSSGVRALAGITGAADPRVVPFVAAFLAVATLATAPLQALVSRRAEARADRFAIALTGQAETAISLEQRLARTNLAELTPNRVLHLIFGTHPTTMERIGIAIEAGDPDAVSGAIDPPRS